MSQTKHLSVLDERAAAVVEPLYALDRRQFRQLLAYYLPRMLLRRLSGRATNEMPDAAFLRDKLVALDADKAAFCYLQCRLLKAARVVEVGTSFGVSTIHLAAAVRDNGGGTVVGTEIEPTKAQSAQRNFAAAGVDAYVDLRVGDALETLKDAGSPVDFVLVDTWIPLARPALDLLVPQLRRGAVVVCDNTVRFERRYASYLERVRDRAGGFHSINLPYEGGLEYSVWLPPAE